MSNPNANENENERSPHLGIFHRETWSDNKQISQVVEQFLSKDYLYDHYHNLASRAADLIEEQLQRTDKRDKLKASVTFRAKNPKSLHAKLRIREELRIRKGKNPYQNADEIRDDVVDLAGVRIVLYMPGEDQREKAENIIYTIWGKDVIRKPHDGTRPELDHSNESKGSSKYRQIHPGYKAVHYRASMKKKHGKQDGSYSWKSYDKVEIQVTSALSHAWAEAGHEAKYKGWANGPPDIQEQRILDALNGIVLSGDLLLEQFHELVKARTYKRFAHVDELRGFLRALNILQVSKVPEAFLEGGLDVLLEFLKKKKKNYPQAVRLAIKDLGLEDNPNLDQVMTRFRPQFTPQDSMILCICLIFHILHKDSRPRKDERGEEGDESEEDEDRMDGEGKLEEPQEYEKGKGREERGDDDEHSPESDESDESDESYENQGEESGDGGGNDDEPGDNNCEEVHDSEFQSGKMCRIMMNALILLQMFAGQPDDATEYLRANRMSEDVRDSLDWILNDIQRHRVLQNENYQPKVKPLIKQAWDWFQQQSEDSASFCGFVFTLAKLEVIKIDDLTTILHKLTMGPLKVEDL
jgi:ppGpp synthetase/RelA/SpoT-type nucleotidyltranferase